MPVAGKTMDSTCQLLNSSNVTSELIDGQNSKGLIISPLQKSDARAQRVSVSNSLNCTPLNGIFWSRRQLQRSRVYASSLFGGLRGDNRHNLPAARVSTNASGEADSKEYLWEKYFSDPSQWWDNTINKKNDRVPDFKHKVTGEALWIVDPSTPQWVKAIHMKAMLMKVTQGGRERTGGSGLRALQGPSQYNRKKLFISKSNNGNGKRDSRRTSTRELRRTAPVDDAGLKHLQNACTAKEAVSILQNHVEQGIATDSYMYVDVLQKCFKQMDLVSAKQVHNCIMKNGMEQNLFVANKLLRVYIRCGKLQIACRVFDKLLKKNVVTWTTMIGGYAENDHATDAIQVYNQMREEGGQPDKITYLSILKACASPAALKWGKEIHSHIKHGGFQSDVHVSNALINMYAKNGSIDDARLVFDEMGDRDVITWNVMIGGLAQHGRGHEAFFYFLQMQKDGIIPDATTYLSILNANASTGALEWLKEVHSHAVKTGLALDIRVGSALVHMYAKSGSIDDARLVFNRMVERNVITWNAMIGGLAQHGYGHEAFSLFLQMQREGLVPDSATYLSILNASASASTGASLEWLKEVHHQAFNAGLDCDIRVGTALVHMYAKSGSIDDARLVFDGMRNRDVITWNAILGGLAQHGCWQEAFSLLVLMQGEGFVPDAATYLSILSAGASASTAPLEWVRGIHRQATEAGLDLDVRVGNALVHIYAKSGSIANARLVFDGMVDRNIVSWNVLISGLAQHGCGHEAFSMFLQMQKDGFTPNSFTFVSILSASASIVALELVKEIHSHAVKAGLDLDLRVGTALVHKYAKSGSIEVARLVFDRMGERNVITWNAMIGGLAQHGYGHEAFSLFLQMQKEGFIPNSTTYVSILNACASTWALEWVKEVHSHAVKSGLDLDVRVGSALVYMYAKSGSIKNARQVFDRMAERNVITWTAMIGGLAQHGCGQEAFSLFLQMQSEGFLPNSTTYLSILSASASSGDLEWVKEVHRHAVSAGLDLDIRVGTALVHMYAKSGSIENARLVFDGMVERNLITWNAMIGGLAQHGCVREAFSLFLQMQRKGFVADATTYVSILNACASTGALEWAKEVHSHIVNAGLDCDVRVGTALVHMYAKTGSIDDAKLVFHGMLDRDVVTWNALIDGLAQHGRGQEALQLFEVMKSEGVKPDGYSFMAVLSACSHAGLVDEGRCQFSSMTEEFGMVPSMEHYTCLVDLLGRAGHLEEAKLVIIDMPLEPNGAPWGALLGACRNHGNLELAEFAAKERLKLEPKDSSTYVLLSNIYAAAGKWDQVSLVLSMIQGRNIGEEPGCSWIEIDDKIHRFVLGDTSHPAAKEIYSDLHSLIKRLKAAGYIPDTQLVLHNIDEEDKELVLCSHSEKLAITYGLLRTPRGKPIRVYKNIRVCSDCHTATKFISKVTGREIVVRDANRFHHFQDGVCSCGDYW